MAPAHARTHTHVRPPSPTPLPPTPQLRALGQRASSNGAPSSSSSSEDDEAGGVPRAQRRAYLRALNGYGRLAHMLRKQASCKQCARQLPSLAYEVGAAALMAVVYWVGGPIVCVVLRQTPCVTALMSGCTWALVTWPGLAWPALRR